jgi:hypothetical protein
VTPRGAGRQRVEGSVGHGDGVEDKKGDGRGVQKARWGAATTQRTVAEAEPTILIKGGGQM